MTTVTILLLLVAAASTIAFSPPPGRIVMDEFGNPIYLVRRRRDIPAASKSGSGATSYASSSSSSSNSGSGQGFSHTFSSRGGFDGAQGYNGVNPGGVAFPNNNDYQNAIPNYGFAGQNQYNPYGGAGYVPVDFNALFQQYINFMQRAAQQSAYAPKGYGNFVDGPSYYYAWSAGGTSSSPTSVASTPNYHKAEKLYRSPSSARYSTDLRYNKLLPWTQNKTPTSTLSQYYSSPTTNALHYNLPTTKTNFYNSPTMKAQYYSSPTTMSQYYSSPTTMSQYYSSPTTMSQYYNSPTTMSQYYNSPTTKALYYNSPTTKAFYYGLPTTAQYKSSPTSTAQYYSSPTSTARYYSSPASAAQHFSTVYYSRDASGAPVRQHYSHSSARIAFKPLNSTRYNTPDYNTNFGNSVPGGYNDSPAPDFSGLNTRAGFPEPDNFGAPSGFEFPGATNFGTGNFGGSPSDGSPVSASASANLGPRGGFGSASISPPPQSGLASRMGSVPPSDGNNFSVFTSSSSSSSDDNGVKKSSKEATSVINDNGKVTTYHVSDP